MSWFSAIYAWNGRNKVDLFSQNESLEPSLSNLEKHAKGWSTQGSQPIEQHPSQDGRQGSWQLHLGNAHKRL